MIYGAHAIIYSRAPREARALLEKILDTQKVDAGGGWLIFALPPAEIAVHPTDGMPRQDVYLMCQDIEKTILELREKGITFTRPVRDESWGRITAISLPGGGELGLYQPRHQTAAARPVASAKASGSKAPAGTRKRRQPTRSAARPAARKPAPKPAALKSRSPGGR